MKGVIFTEFLEMIEDRFGLEQVDRLIESTELESGGTYTSVGTYDFHELIQMVVQLSNDISVPVPDLVKAFGNHLFGRFITSYPSVLEGVENAAQFLANVEGIIHVDVRKLYPDAELPGIDFIPGSGKDWKLEYRSMRPFADLCEGLIAACIDHFGDRGELTREDLETTDSSHASSFFFKAEEQAD